MMRQSRDKKWEKIMENHLEGKSSISNVVSAANKPGSVFGLDLPSSSKDQVSKATMQTEVPGITTSSSLRPLGDVSLRTSSKVLEPNLKDGMTCNTSSLVRDANSLDLSSKSLHAQMSWANLFKSSGSGHPFSSVELLSHIKASVDDFVEFDDSELNEIRKSWFSSLIGRFLHKPPSHFLIRNWAFSVWFEFNIEHIIDLENDFFLFRFDYEDNAIKVFSGGPWAFRGNLINL
ncbi:hypothetical protein Cni_G10307 [Canna indica]|uniref:DUF4283 domain-containing protein n=1 Tax=Canna indica TaxID=4628 RepID=A0AAQ3QAI8_9LILI|nr:hypothetical protein Cni_G10307 [Canna indica]